MSIKVVVCRIFKHIEIDITYNKTRKISSIKTKCVKNEISSWWCVVSCMKKRSMSKFFFTDIVIRKKLSFTTLRTSKFKSFETKTISLFADERFYVSFLKMVFSLVFLFSDYTFNKFWLIYILDKNWTDFSSCTKFFISRQGQSFNGANHWRAIF